jgi:hypothetical protein
MMKRYASPPEMENFAFVAMKEMITKTALEPLEPVLQPITFKHNKYVVGLFVSLFYENKIAFACLNLRW